MDYHFKISLTVYLFLIGAKLGNRVATRGSFSISDISIFVKKLGFLILILYLLRDWFLAEYIADDIATVKIQVYDLLLTISITYSVFKYRFHIDFEFIKGYKDWYGRKIPQYIRAWYYKNVDRILLFKTTKKNNWLEHSRYSDSLHEARHALAFYNMRELFYKAQVDESLAKVVGIGYLDPLELKYQQQHRIMMLAGSLDESLGGREDREQWEELIKLLLEDNVVQVIDRYYYKNPKTSLEIENNNKIIAEIYQQDLQAAREFIANNYLLVEELALLLNRKKALYYRDLISFWNRVKQK